MWRTQMRISVQDAVLVGLLEIAVLAVAGVLLADGRITPGQMLAASQYVLLASTIGAAASGVMRLVRSRAAAARTHELLAQPAMTYGTAEAPAGGGRLEFRDVHVASGGRPVLSGVDLVVPAGALVAIVGASGSGKSLLAALAGRLADPDAGEILLDGVPLQQLVAIGAAGGDRLRLRAAGADRRHGRRRDRVRRVVAVADHDRAGGARRPRRRLHPPPADGYDTPLEQAPMSGGEAQRVGLARTFAHARRVVVLDDVAASLDAVTEHEIGEVLTRRAGEPHADRRRAPRRDRRPRGLRRVAAGRPRPWLRTARAAAAVSRLCGAVRPARQRQRQRPRQPGGSS